MSGLKRIAPVVRTLAAGVSQGDYLPDPVYGTRQWRAAREQAIVAAKFCCSQCGRRGPRVRLFVDHVVELKDGGAAYEQSNLRVLCGSCHTLKTAKVRTERQATRYGSSDGAARG